MLTITRITTLALLLLSACSERTTTDPALTPEQLDEEEWEACDGWVQWQATCREQLGLTPLETGLEQGNHDPSDPMELCMGHFFKERLEPCRDEALARLRCEATESCDVLMPTETTTSRCTHELYVMSVCMAGPEEWEAYDCDASKCPGECCGNAPGLDDG